MLALFTCCIGAIGIYFLLPGSSLVGIWESEPDPIFKIKTKVEFRKDGTGKMTILEGMHMHFNYTQSGNEVTLDFTEAEMGAMKVPARGNEARQRWEVRRDGDTLHVNVVEGKGRGSTTFKKIG